MAGGSKPAGSTTTTTKSEPWEGQMPYLREQFQTAQSLFKSGQLAPQYYNGPTLAAEAPETLMARDLIADRARKGSHLTHQASDTLYGTLRGDYMRPGSNPWLDATFDQAAGRVTDAYRRGTAAQTDAAFNQAGAYGGSAYKERVKANEEQLGDTLNRLATDTYGKNYQDERQRQMQGMLFAPDLANQDFLNYEQLARVGAAKEGYAQDLIDEDMKRYSYTANLPYNALANYIGLTGGNYGGTNTATEPYYRNRTGEALGSLGQVADIGGKAAMAYMMFSDFRLKENIVPVGTENGFKVYEFNYIDVPSYRFIGVMAQDVQKTRPDAVHESGGFLAVDYNAIGVEFRRV